MLVRGGRGGSTVASLVDLHSPRLLLLVLLLLQLRVVNDLRRSLGKGIVALLQVLHHVLSGLACK